jgi:hypothetical protein
MVSRSVPASAPSSIRDPDSLSSAQRITVPAFRRRSPTSKSMPERRAWCVALGGAIEVQIVDDGMGFEVERALAKAAQRGRLGLAASPSTDGRRDLRADSRPGGPTP